jgi:type I restriction enzyme S subunit
MHSNWYTTTIGEIADVYDGPHATPQKTAQGPIYLGISNLVNGRIDLNSVEHLSEEDYTKWTRRIEPRAGDVVFSYETRLGEAAIIPLGLRCCLGRRMGLLRVKKEWVVPEYLRYAYLGPEFQELLRQRTVHGSTVDRIPLIEMPQFPIRLPPLPEQRAIAAILGALDNKIELNRRMNATLEAMARAIFQSWFVDFDPVRAQAEGRETGLPAEIAALFPDEFVESEIGEIPAGWKIKTIGELAGVVGGSTPSTKDPTYWTDGQHCWVTPKDLSSLITPVLISTERKITDAGLAQIGSGLLPPGTVLLSSRAPIGYLAISDIPVAINQGFIAMKPIEGVPSVFLLYWAESAREEIVARANGSTFLEISKANFRPIPVVAPDRDVFAAFGDLVGPMHEKVVLNEKQSFRLATLRNNLLPKLVSGQLQVPLAADLINEAIV